MYDERISLILVAANSWHDGQMRDDGESFIMHPVSVALILSNHGLYSYEHLASALLHDVMEDCDAKYKVVKTLAGGYVADIVELLTKTEDVPYWKYYEGIYANNIAVNVKVADRIHNLLTMNVWDEEKQKKYLEHTNNDYLKSEPGTFPMGKVSRELLMSLLRVVRGSERRLGIRD